MEGEVWERGGDGGEQAGKKLKNGDRRSNIEKGMEG